MYILYPLIRFKNNNLPFDRKIPMGFGAFFKRVILISSGMSFGKGGL